MNLKEALDTANYVCTLDILPRAVYGPYSAEDAMDFCAHYNDENERLSLPGRWIAIPILPCNNERFQNV